MRILLLLNGPDGWQTGIEDGFNNLLSINYIDSLKFFYVDHHLSVHGKFETNKEIYNIALNFQPDIVIWFHINKFPLDAQLLNDIRQINSRPIIVYDEGDMYGGWEKPITSAMKKIMTQSDIVSIRGLGSFAKDVEFYNKNVFYTPHHADIARFDCNSEVGIQRSHWSIFIGNRIRSRMLGGLKRIPGANEREKFVRYLGSQLGESFNLFGHGWDGFVSHRGIVPFQDQIKLCRDSWVQFSYEHYPEIPYYFSNRLPISLMSGCLYICHYHKGYEHIFPSGDFIFSFQTFDEALDINRYLISLPLDDLIERSKRARDFAYTHYHPHRIWRRFMDNVIKLGTSKNPSIIGA